MSTGRASDFGQRGLGEDNGYVEDVDVGIRQEVLELTACEPDDEIVEGITLQGHEDNINSQYEVADAPAEVDVLSHSCASENGNTYLNPASLAIGPPPQKTSIPRRPGLTGTTSERDSQQLLHEALELRDIHKATSLLPAALGSSPFNIATVLWELAIWPPDYLQLVRLHFSIRFFDAAGRCLRSALGADCFDQNHALYGTWSARAGTHTVEDNHTGTLYKTWSAPGGNSSADEDDKPYISDGMECVGRGAYILLLEQVVYGMMRAGKWEAALERAMIMLDLDQGDDCGMRFIMPVGMLKLGMGLQCVKFCMSWLDELDGASPAPVASVGGVYWAGQGGGGVVGGVDLGLDMVQGRYVRKAGRWPRMAFLVALGCWYMFYDSGQVLTAVTHTSKRNSGGNGNGSGLPVCKSARAWLRLGHKSNRHVLRILLTMITHRSTYLGPTKYLAGQTATDTNSPKIPDPMGYEEANDFVYSTHKLFMDEARDVQRWLVDTAHAWVINTCPGCGQKEGKVGEHKACLGCRGELYCGVECQTRCWGGHKSRCKEVARERKLRELGRGSAMLKGRVGLS